MKKLNVTWDVVHDSTGYMFSLAKSLSCAVKNSPWADCAEDIIATSGFAFRMWVSNDLCPSSTNIWNLDSQKIWIENGGLTCDYVGRYWEQDAIEKEKHLEAIEKIRKSINMGIPAISWDISGMEWGLLIGYDDETQMFWPLTLHTGYSNPKISPFVDGTKMPYEWLGKWQLPILSILTITGNSNKSKEVILCDTMKLAVSHLSGEEWCENSKGLEAYPALIRHFETDFNLNLTWNAEYYLGTFGALKYYAWKYFEKMKQDDLALIYKAVYDAWMEAFRIKTNEDVTRSNVCNRISSLLNYAYEYESKAVILMKQ